MQGDDGIRQEVDALLTITDRMREQEQRTQQAINPVQPQDAADKLLEQERKRDRALNPLPIGEDVMARIIRLEDQLSKRLRGR